MSRQFYFITHPNVVVGKDVPVPRWPLSELGQARMRNGLQQPWVKELAAIYCSTEQKAIDGARNSTSRERCAFGGHRLAWRRGHLVVLPSRRAGH